MLANAATSNPNTISSPDDVDDDLGYSSSSKSNSDQQDDKSASMWVMRMVMDKEAMLDKDVTMDDINFCLNQYTKECVYSDYNSNELVFRLRFTKNDRDGSSNKIGTVSGETLDQTDEIYYIKKQTR